MNISEGPVGLPPSSPSLGPERSGWQRIGNALGRVFSAILSIPSSSPFFSQKVTQLHASAYFIYLLNHLKPKYNLRFQIAMFLL